MTGGPLATNTNDNDESTWLTFHVIGDAYVDFFCFLDGDWPEHGGDSSLSQPVKSYAGGSSTNTATHLKSLLNGFCCNTSPNPSVILHTTLNPDDHYGQILVQHLREHGVPLKNCRKNDATTGHCIAIVSGGERSFMTHQGCVGGFRGDQLDSESIANTRSDVHVHVAGFFNVSGFWHGQLQEQLQYIRDQRKHTGYSTTITLVTQHDATKQWDGGLDGVIPLLDFLIMNDLEAKNILKRGKERHYQNGFNNILDDNNNNCDTVQEWARYFQIVSPDTHVIVTRGPEGAVALYNGKVIIDQKAISVKAIDPTGAGDSFTAGFLHGIWEWKEHSISEGFIITGENGKWPVEAIRHGLRWGCAVGRAAVQVRGASVPAKTADILNYYQQLGANNTVISS